jgi:hypothetical protein
MPRMWWRRKARPCWATVPIRHRTSSQEATWKAAKILGSSARFYIEPRYMVFGFSSRTAKILRHHFTRNLRAAISMARVSVGKGLPSGVQHRQEADLRPEMPPDRRR